MMPHPPSTNAAGAATATEPAAAARRPERLLINWVYYQAVGHAIEAYKMAAQVAAANPGLEVCVLLNATTAVELAALERDLPRVRSAYDVGLLNQLRLAGRCDLHISPHTGFSFAVQCVGTPWLALSANGNREYVLNGVPFASQYTHGDCHGGNLLIADGDVSGFIDLDHLPVGPRGNDLFYLMADRVKERIYDADWLAERRRLLPWLLTGYEREVTLTDRERAALWPGMLATQLFFVQVFAEKDNQEHVARNLRALIWIHEHRDDIRRLLEGPQDHPPPPASRVRSVP